MTESTWHYLTNGLMLVVVLAQGGSMRDDRWQEWTDDQRKDEALARRAGFASVDEWVDALNDAAEIIKADNEETEDE